MGVAANRARDAASGRRLLGRLRLRRPRAEAAGSHQRARTACEAPEMRKERRVTVACEMRICALQAGGGARRRQAGM